MKEKVLLYLMDEALVLFKGEETQGIVLHGSIQEMKKNLLTHLQSKDILFLLIDRSQQDIHEDNISSLFFWDRWQLLFHKKTHYFAQGGHAGFQVFKQNNERYLRWVHILPTDSLTEWISFVQQQGGHVIFITPEVRRFCKTQKVSPPGYDLVLYTGPFQTLQHMVFKGQRLLLMRPSHTQEDVKTSLHFLSRTYHDIHENLTSHSCSVQDLVSFVQSQAKSSFYLSSTFLFFSQWRKRGMIAALSLFALWGGMEVYEGNVLRGKVVTMKADLNTMKATTQRLTAQLQGKNGAYWRTAVSRYEALRPSLSSPLQDVYTLAEVLNPYPLFVESFVWHHQQVGEMKISFVIEAEAPQEALTIFEDVLVISQKAFPDRKVHVLEAPFNSSPCETFKGSGGEACSRVQLVIGGK